MPRSALAKLLRTAGWTGFAIGGMGAAALAGTGVLAAAGYTVWRRRRAYPLAGKVVLISGSRGLGFAIAREFLRHGSRVALCARDAEELARAATLLGAFGEVFTVAADLAQPDAPARVVARVERDWGPVDVLVHNAGVMQLGPWNAMEESDFRAAMDIHFWAALRLCQAVLPGMIARRGGRIVNISSIGGLVAVPHMLPYTASKFALTGLSQGLHAEVARHGVRVTTVCPWLTRTGSQGNAVVKGDHEREFAWFAASGAVPGLTQSATAAARRILRACRQGEAQVVLALPGKLIALAHGLAPGAVVNAMGVAERWLPHPGARPGSPARSGADSYNDWTRRMIRPLVRRAGEELNQREPSEAASAVKSGVHRE